MSVLDRYSRKRCRVHHWPAPGSKVRGHKEGVAVLCFPSAARGEVPHDSYMEGPARSEVKVQGLGQVRGSGQVSGPGFGVDSLRSSSRSSLRNAQEGHQSHVLSGNPHRTGRLLVASRIWKRTRDTLTFDPKSHTACTCP